MALKSDKITLNRIKEAHPVLRSELVKIYVDILNANVSIRFTDVYRNFIEQDALFRQGRTSPGKIVTYARAGESYHNFGLAVDFCLLLNNGKAASWDREKDVDKDNIADWEEVVKIFKSYGWKWGGDWKFKDYPHFQKSFGYSTEQLVDLPMDTDGYPKIKI